MLVVRVVRVRVNTLRFVIFISCFVALVIIFLCMFFCIFLVGYFVNAGGWQDAFFNAFDLLSQYVPLIMLSRWSAYPHAIILLPTE